MVLQQFDVDRFVQLNCFLSEKKANEMDLARTSNKGCISSGSELSSENAKGNPQALKQKSLNTMRIWWFPLLARGKLHVDILDESFPGETPAGAAALVSKIRSALNVRFQNAASQPKFLFTDRGRGFFFGTAARSRLNTNRLLPRTTFKLLWGTTPLASQAVCKTSCYMRLLSPGFVIGWHRAPHVGAGRRRAQNMGGA